MVTPALLLTPAEQRNATGPVAVTPSDSVEVRDGAWWLARGIGDASLLLSPDGSYDADGPVEPDTINGPVPVVAGDYGGAWAHRSNETGNVRFLVGGIGGSGAGTILLRFRPAPLSDNNINPHVLYGSGFNLYRNWADTRYNWSFGGLTTGELIDSGIGVMSAIAARWEGDQKSLMRNGDVIASGGLTPPVSLPASMTLGASSYYSPHGDVEGVLIYDTALPNAEITRLSTMDRAWTWGPDGTLSAPLATPPATLLVRTRDGETVTTHHVTLADGAGEAGGATVTHDGTTLTIGTDDEVEVVGVLAFDEALSGFDIERYSRMAWVWENFLPPEPMPPLPPQPPVTHGTHTILTAHKVVTINGVPTETFGFDAQHGVNQPIGTGAVTLPLPLPDHLRGSDGAVLNKEIEVKAGYDETGLRTRFSGRIDADSMDINERDRTATLQMRGWATLLDWEEEDDLVFSGPIALHEIIRSLCAWRGVPAYSVIDVNTHEGGPALLGGNRHVNNGEVIIPRRTSPLAWIDRKLRLYGYRIFDTPSGEVRVRRVSGEPIGGASSTYTEGVNCYRLSRTRDLKPMQTNWTVEGATYVDDDGVSIPVRSFPASVPPDDLLTPPGYRSGRLTDNDIVTIPRAHTIRYVQEVDHARPYHELRWETWADPARQPGEAVTLNVPTFEAQGRYWLMGISERFDQREYVANLSAWVGGTTSLPSGDDLEEVHVGAGPWHVGDEYLSHYAVPSPQGTTITIPVTIPSDVTSIAIRGYGHGMNSYLIDGANADATVSKIEVWQGGGDRPVGTAELPVMPENLLQRLNYRDGLRHWTSFRMPVPGRLDAGRAEIRLVAGEDSRAMAHTKVDDFEARDIVLELRGHGRPTLPRKGL